MKVSYIPLVLSEGGPGIRNRKGKDYRRVVDVQKGEVGDEKIAWLLDNT